MNRCLFLAVQEVEGQGPKNLLAMALFALRRPLQGLSFGGEVLGTMLMDSGIFHINQW